jgi:hypothetical protein
MGGGRGKGDDGWCRGDGRGRAGAVGGGAGAAGSGRARGCAGAAARRLRGRGGALDRAGAVGVAAVAVQGRRAVCRARSGPGGASGAGPGARWSGAVSGELGARRSGERVWRRRGENSTAGVQNLGKNSPARYKGGRRQDLWRRPPDRSPRWHLGVGAKIYGADPRGLVTSAAT